MFEVWDKDETSSDFLGSCEMHLSCLIKKGKKLTRTLAEGLGAEGGDTTKLPDGRPAAFQYQGEEEGQEQDRQHGGDVGTGMQQPFEIPYLTDVFVGNGVELIGSTITTSLANRPMIFFEAFVIPPLPEDLVLPEPLPVKEEQDLWKRWTRR